MSAIEMDVSHEWQPISTAPKDGSLFLGCHAKHGFIEIMRYNGIGFGRDQFPVMFPTHWMPLPEPPTISEEDKA